MMAEFWRSKVHAVQSTLGDLYSIIGLWTALLLTSQGMKKQHH